MGGGRRILYTLVAFLYRDSLQTHIRDFGQYCYYMKKCIWENWMFMLQQQPEKSWVPSDLSRMKSKFDWGLNSIYDGIPNMGIMGSLLYKQLIKRIHDENMFSVLNFQDRCLNITWGIIFSSVVIWYLAVMQSRLTVQWRKLLFFVWHYFSDREY